MQCPRYRRYQSRQRPPNSTRLEGWDVRAADKTLLLRKTIAVWRVARLKITKSGLLSPLKSAVVSQLPAAGQGRSGSAVPMRVGPEDTRVWFEMFGANSA